MMVYGSDGERSLQKENKTTRRALAFYKNRVFQALNPAMWQFISQRDMVFLATADAKGACDSSVRTGIPGFVRILSEKKLAYPEYRGNGVMASLGNIRENPNIGMLFLDFYETTIGLHVNGKACIVENADVSLEPALAGLLIDKNAIGPKAERWVCVEVEEAYIHCSKHIPLMKKLDKEIHWGTDEKKLKRGDFFNSKSGVKA